ncbi:hypothetical protein MF672_015905 [Actinomadura sp. ATCC 31491]|uniref:Tetratricopeptide repeat protein n=1 Tax=Actinomadura luzonensis TaxID=2805427 RepID=A0ABT0FSD9_9ACTN|nr:hypothetical protein [Actinomadura luzonensis]MCK2215261.1 hypothetical protein [Actinomadura luzonensis]
MPSRPREKGLAIFTGIRQRHRYRAGPLSPGIVLSRVECLAFPEASKQRDWEQRVCSRLAETFFAAERHPEAVRHAEQALIVSRDIGHPTASPCGPLAA